MFHSIRFIFLSTLIGLAGHTVRASETYYNSGWANHLFAEERTQVQPLFDHPLRDGFILAAPDSASSGELRRASGGYYLTGTASADGKDFRNNDGVWLWRSDDLQSWTPIGQVWSIERDGTAWQKEPRVNPDDPYAPAVRGMTGCKIHFIKGQWYIPYSMNGQGSGLLRSRTHKAEGPYEDLGRITANTGAASMFEDVDGSVYWVYGRGWIARMNDDLTGLAEEPVLLTPKPDGNHGGKSGEYQIPHVPSSMGEDGAVITRIDKTYYLTVAAVKTRLGQGNYETMVARADQVKGPYSQRRLMIPHGGQANLFKAHDGRLMASFAGRDRKAALRDRPAVVPVRLTKSTLYGNPGNDNFDYPRIDPAVTVEVGPWHLVKPLVPTSIRDLCFIRAPDGNYYLSGSLMGKDSTDRLIVYRSRDLFNWETVDTGVRWTDIPGIDASNAAARLNDSFNWMDTEFHWVGDTFWYMGTLYDYKPKGGPTIPGAFFIFASESGKAEGPWKFLFEGRSQPSIFRDDDGTTYLVNNHNISALKADLSGLSGERFTVTSAQGLTLNRGDAPATHILKVESPSGKRKYMLFNCNWNGMFHDRADDGTYDWAYYWADKFDGPYHRNRKSLPIPHAGHSCAPLLAADGHWYAAFFGNDLTSPWWCRPGLIRLKLRWDGEEPAFDIDENLVPGPVVAK